MVLAAGRVERVELVSLVLEEAGEDLFEGSLAVAELEAALGWDGFELLVGELPDPS